MKWQQTTQRWIETVTATKTSTNTIVKYRQGHGFLSPQNVKWRVSKFRLVTFVVSPKKGLCYFTWSSCCPTPIYVVLGLSNFIWLLGVISLRGPGRDWERKLKLYLLFPIIGSNKEKKSTASFIYRTASFPSSDRTGPFAEIHTVFDNPLSLPALTSCTSHCTCTKQCQQNSHYPSPTGTRCNGV